MQSKDENLCVHCLVVDDNQDNSYILWRMLRSLGIPSETADNGYEAMTYCKKEMPDIIFLDWMMPGMDGIMFMQELKRLVEQNKEEAVMPIIIMCSGRFGESEIRTALTAGAKGYLQKPFDESMLQDELSKISCGPELLSHTLSTHGSNYFH